MFPTLQDLLGFGPALDTHSVFVALGVFAALAVFFSEAKRRGFDEDRIIYVVLGALAGGAVFMRLGTWAQHLDPSRNLSLVEQLAHGNASILSGLVGAWLGAHVAKKVMRYKVRTGDLFAPALALGMAIGRFGCLFTENPGSPTGTGWGIVLSPAAAARLHAPAGVPLHPSFVYEIVFHAVAFVVLWTWLRHRAMAPGATFTLYLGAYAVFRFLVEFVRANDVAWLGMSRPQLFLAVSIPLLFARIAWEARRGRYSARHEPHLVKENA
ncbi:MULTISPECIES: prolipoprotein diacylglyceryl transferase family protein [Arthrobacter]|uniref:Prolipoprotein diacylglyceryl transferase family protein n=2 Tax=Arthrobacter TaxID=1663 RepID=A0ABU9KIA1_9MICC|nr:prolipoprotein diacylglyceryl transferase family protein [Arthrobacter sp. YJM1]MDP5226383.1 prolipoprotein diacylglyceryl transferase [Arthrobacter sp. YJM1]